MGQEPEPPKGLLGRHECASLRSTDSLCQALNCALGIHTGHLQTCVPKGHLLGS